MIFAVLATGPSLTQAVVDAVHDRVKVVAVSDAYRLAPWADALVSTDFAWWRRHPEAAEFKGQKFSGMVDYQRVEGVERIPGENATNSGLLGIKVAAKLGATKVLLCGFDMRRPGEHFFGRHEGLRSTSAARMEHFKTQFERYKPPGVEVVNCTPGSALKAYRLGDLEEELAASAVLVA